MYNPKGYNMYALPNVFDKNNQGKKDFVFFFPRNDQYSQECYKEASHAQQCYQARSQ